MAGHVDEPQGADPAPAAPVRRPLAAPDSDAADLPAAVWRRLLLRRPEDAELSALYGPLMVSPPGGHGGFVLGRIAQSLDGRIATLSGASRWISGPADIRHTHRLRALFDAVVVGAGTIAADDPLLTTRACEGPSPVRVVLDPARRLPPTHRVFGDGPPTVLVCRQTPALMPCGRATILPLPAADGGISPQTIVAALAARGLRRLFIEGGGVTVSRFLLAGVLDRLHVTVAPLLLGPGVPAFTLPSVATPDAALRFGWVAHHLGADLLLDIDLRAQRP